MSKPPPISSIRHAQQLQVRWRLAVDLRREQGVDQAGARVSLICVSSDVHVLEALHADWETRARSGEFGGVYTPACAGSQ